MSRRLCIRLAWMSAFVSLPGCDLLAVTDHLCLERVLDVAGMSAEDLTGTDADARLAEALEIAADALGDSPVLDCSAEDSLSSFLGDLGDGGGVLVHAWNGGDVADQAGNLVQDGIGRGGEVALVVDTTGSMQDDTMELRDNIDKVLREVEQQEGTIAVAFYGDNQNCDADWYNRNRGGLLDPADDRITTASRNWEDALTGGCDRQESLYDAVWKTANELEWTAEDRRIIVITDASAHDERTNHTQAEVETILTENGIVLDTILVGLAF